jgi:uncharacterized protein YjbJ (UPF0337 family)
MNNMNWDQIEGKWKQFAGSARERWANSRTMTGMTIAGKKEQLVGLQEAVWPCERRPKSRPTNGRTR